MVVKMREGDHKHRQAGRQAGRHVTGHLLIEGIGDEKRLRDNS